MPGRRPGYLQHKQAPFIIAEKKKKEKPRNSAGLI